MKHLIGILCITVLFLSCHTESQSKIADDKLRINSACDAIMNHFLTGKVAEVSSILKANSSLIGNAEIDTLQTQILQQFESGDFSQYGNVISYELVKEVNVGNFASKRYYVLRFDRFYMTFSFSLYKSKKGWEITGFKYTEDNSALF